MQEFLTRAKAESLIISRGTISEQNNLYVKKPEKQEAKK